jgi:hypothetical protein
MEINAPRFNMPQGYEKLSEIPDLYPNREYEGNRFIKVEIISCDNAPWFREVSQVFVNYS